MSRSSAVGVGELIQRLGRLEVDGPSAMQWLPDALREVTGCDSAGMYSYALEDDHIVLDRCHVAGWPIPAARAIAALNVWMRDHRRVQGCYDARRPEPWQRGRVIVAPSCHYLLRNGWPPLYRGRLAPLDEHMVEGQRCVAGDRPTARVLVCDGASLLAYVGLFHEHDLTAAQARILRSLVPSMTRRLRLERDLDAAAAYRGGLESALEQLPVAAFLISSRRRILVENELGRRLLAADRAISAALLGVRGPDRTIFEVTPIATGATTQFLALHRPSASAGAARLAFQAQRWRLTRREAEVAAWLIRGTTNRVIADELGCAESTVEIHVSRILRKSGVPTRAAFVAAVFGA